MSAIGTSVSLKGLPQEDWALTVNLSGSPTTSDVGKPVTQDTSADNTFKLCGDGDVIHGILDTVEARTVEGTTIGTVIFKGGYEFQVATQGTVARGDSVMGAASATVKKIAFTTGTVNTANVEGLTQTQLGALGNTLVTAVRSVSTTDYATVILK